jgi:hypothetical protein
MVVVNKIGSQQAQVVGLSTAPDLAAMGGHCKLLASFKALLVPWQQALQ